MGFPRILSKNNKIYTKLGEFCLSGDSFWIVCHTCQEELQTQDQFWKHVQDEHNFMHGVTKQEQQNHPASYCLEVDGGAASANNSGTGNTTSGGIVNLPQLPMYHRKFNEDEQRDTSSVEMNEQQRDSETHASAISADESSSTAGVSGINIKLEPTATALALTTDQQVATNASSNVSNTAIYHVPPPPPTAYTTANTNNNNNTTQPQGSIMHTTPISLPTISMTVTPSAITAAAAAAMLATQELPPKDSNSTTASASSAVSSEDGERWYICDYETCGLKFKYMSRLELHRVVHSKERRFICDLCSASFKQSCNLSTHRKKKHALKGTKGATQPPQRY